jgi:hypothetical protein
LRVMDASLLRESGCNARAQGDQARKRAGRAALPEIRRPAAMGPPIPRQIGGIALALPAACLS